MDVLLFPFAEYWWFYLAFTGFVLVMLALDLGVFHRHAHAVSVREATVWSAVWVGLALAFGYAFYLYAASAFANDSRLVGIPGFDAQAAARRIGLEYLTGYIVEKSLAVDNIFVFVVVFSFFGIPPAYQHRVLFYGILGALLFRAIFIALGAVLLQYSAVVMVFGAFLILTGIKLLFGPEKPIEPEKNPVIKLFRRIVPVTTTLHGQHFFVSVNGVRHATPLLVALVFLELTDVIFAVDSVPAIFALTSEPLVVYTSNVFAILGLRSMYFMLASAMDKFHLLKYGLGLVLVFVGLKMVWLNDAFGGKFPILWSLGIIVGIIATAVVLSFVFPRTAESELERPGTAAR